MYMGVFDEDIEIKVSTIIKLWVSEGFLKPRKNKNLETVAREYFQELVDRNLVLPVELKPSGCWVVDAELGWVGMTRLCKMHDLIRDLSLREAQKQRFYHVYSKRNHPSSDRHRCIVIPDKSREKLHGPRIISESSVPNSRSYVCHDQYVEHFPDLRLLRTLHTTYRGDDVRIREFRQKDVFGLVNSRLLTIAVERDRYWATTHKLRSSIGRLWSLHTLHVYSWYQLEGPVELWNMHQLKHVEFTCKRLRLQLPPPNNDNNIVILENLHTLVGMLDFHLNGDVVRRMPNLTIFDVSYNEEMNLEVHTLSYLQCLSKLESLCCSIGKNSGENLQQICFPHSLKQILLIDDWYTPRIEWEDVLQKIGRLPFLEELGIQGGIFRRGEWETIEGQFLRLKTLELIKCDGLKKWTVSEASHFPLLQRLILESLEELEEIPSEIGEIATLKLIEVRYCGESVGVSAIKIVEEQEDLYGEEQLSFRVLVIEARKY